ncbi:diguanylate cyclase (GGDEF)-like protein [Sphaerotilus hippei]|uniref:Diguanylate cyclase (GGDEF)-like protein n=1 Tax=Sphaerotilus hippei TaxID=744406 RepID=A0A318H2P2_9BURK|nr:EAL domain-containing protein [Sphaerotilus hippei]PXW97513.1 diguanylate cyclase (GGDEF)-like protein [Sphaerotilus hippei]
MRFLFLSRLSPFRSVRGRFSLAMGASGIVFGLLLTAFMEWRWEVGIQEGAQRTLQVTAHKIARTLVEDLDNRQQEISLMADLLSSTGLSDPEQVRPLLDGLQKRQPAYAWIGLTGRSGQVLAASRGLLEGKDISSRPWFAHGLQGIYLGDPHDAKLLASHLHMGPDGEPPRFVDVAVPIRGPRGEARGVLGAHLYWNWVQDIIRTTSMDLGNTASIEVLIASKEGIWLYKPRHETSTDLAALERQGASGTHFSARARVRTKAAVEDLAWTVIVREETRHTFESIAWNRRLMLLFSVIVAMAFAGITWLISGRVVRPIVALAEIARAHRSLRGAQPALPGGKPQDETGVLGQVMHQLAFHDVLTGLANRRQLRDRLLHALGTRQRGAVLLVNIDHFSLLNDTRGHDIGDQLLMEIASRLASLIRPDDTLARLGSDEFVLLLKGLSAHREEAEAVAGELAQQALQRIQEPVTLGNELYPCKASIGICLFGEQDTDAAELLKRADMAMFEAKRAGRNRVRFFDSSMQALLEQRVQLEQQLRRAIPDELVLMYQKQVDDQGQVLGAEALVRWRHPGMGMVSPARFIPLAEETGLIIPIGQWVLETACRQIRRWQDLPHCRHLMLAINVSTREFSQPDFVGQVLDTLERTGADPSRLKLEMTESILATDMDGVVARMSALRARGVSFSLDDFGTGFSSLAYLKNMPLDQLKIDQSFVRDVTRDTSEAAIVRTVIALGRSLGLAVIAEGVETDEQRAFLVDSGCRHFQGYLFGRPATLEDFEAGLTPG